MTRQTLDLASALADTSRRFYARGWVLGTSGNFSVLASREPFRLAITASGRDKRTLQAADIVVVDADGRLASDGDGRPSAETLLHVVIAQRRQAGAISHTHYTHSGVDRGFQPVCFGPA